MFLTRTMLMLLVKKMNWVPRGRMTMMMKKMMMLIMRMIMRLRISIVAVCGAIIHCSFVYW